LIVIVHDDGEDGAWGICLGPEEKIHSVWQCARCQNDENGNGNGFLHIERCRHLSWWRHVLGLLGLISFEDARDAEKQHTLNALAKLEAHWAAEHPGASWTKRQGARL